MSWHNRKKLSIFAAAALVAALAPLASSSTASAATAGRFIHKTGTAAYHPVPTGTGAPASLDKENPPVFHSLQPFTWKQEEFRAEHELRLMIDVAPPGHPFRHLPIEPKGHREIQIGLHTLIESLVVGPNSAEATVEEVRTLLGRSRLEMPLRVSRLSRLPYH